LTVAVYLRDDDGRARLLASLPTDIASTICKPLTANRRQFARLEYDVATQRVFLLRANAEFVVVWTLEKCTHREAETIRTLLAEESIGTGRQATLSPEVAKRVYRAATGRALASGE
jgi:hypothetical protein